MPPFLKYQGGCWASRHLRFLAVEEHGRLTAERKPRQQAALRQRLQTRRASWRWPPKAATTLPNKKTRASYGSFDFANLSRRMVISVASTTLLTRLATERRPAHRQQADTTGAEDQA